MPPAAAVTVRLTDTQKQQVEANLGLVHQLLTRHAVPPHVYDDRFQDGCLGLMRAVQKFDPARGLKFSTYAHYWILHAIARSHENDDRNIRRATQNGDTYLPPVLVDPTPRNRDRRAATDPFAVAVTDDAYDGVLDALTAAQTIAALGLTDDERVLLAWPVKDSVRWFGVSHKTIVRRRRLLRQRLAA